MKTVKKVTRSVGTLTDPAITEDLPSRQARIEAAYAKKKIYLENWQKQVFSKDSFLTTREKIVNGKEKDIKARYEQVNQRERLAALYEQNLVETQNSINRQIATLEHKMMIVRNMQNNARFTNNIISSPHVQGLSMPVSDQHTQTTSFHQNKKFKKTNLKTFVDVED